ncbi:MAG: hypothetical protein ACREHE_02220 [Rhizomicrobium sp.]
MPELATELQEEERAQRRALDEAGKLQWRGELQDAHAWTLKASSRGEAELTKIRLKYAERLGAWYPKSEPNPENPPQRDHSHNLIARFTLAGGVFAMLLECVLAGFFSTRFFNLSFWLAALLGLGITVFFATLVLACIAALVLARYPDRARATSRPLILILSIALPTALFFMAVFFLTRGLQTPFLISLFGADTAFLAIDLPIIAGVLLTLRGLFNWSGEYEDEYHRLLTALAGVEDLRIYSERELKDLGDTEDTATSTGISHSGGEANGAPAVPPEGQNGIGTAGKNLLAILLTGLVVSSISLHEARADATVSARAELWLDDTISVDSVDRVQSTNALMDVVPQLSVTHKITKWSLFGFGSNPWREMHFFELELLARPEPPCPEPAPSGDDDLFTGPIDQHNKTCAAFHHRKLAELDEMRRADYRRVATALQSHRPEPADCTSIGDLLKRISQYSNAQYTVVISDGVETCRAGGLRPIPAPQDARRRVVFVLTEGVASAKRQSGKTQEEQFEERRAALLGAAPWLIVITPSMIDENIFEAALAPADTAFSRPQQRLTSSSGSGNGR